MQFLNIVLSPEEQLSFIERLQTARDRELTLLAQQQERISKQVERLDFLNECLRPVHAPTK